MSMSVSVSSCAGTGSCGTRDHEAAISSRRRRASSLRYWSAILREATRMSQASGLSGVPPAGQVVAAASSASCTASSASAKWP